MENKTEEEMPKEAYQNESEIAATTQVSEQSTSHETIEVQANNDVRVINLPGMPNVRLNKKIANAIPDLAPLEMDGLEASIVRKKGCSESPKVWKNPVNQTLCLIDGFARIDICLKHEFPLPQGELVADISDLEAAVQWRIDQHINRRNLGPRWVAYLWGAKYNSTIQQPNGPSVPNEGVPHFEARTSSRVGQEAGVGHATIERYAKFAKAIDILKDCVSPEFGRGLLDRKFKLSKKDIIELSRKSEEDQKAIADVLISYPKLTLSEAEQIVHPSAPQTSQAEGNNQSTEDDGEDTDDEPDNDDEDQDPEGSEGAQYGGDSQQQEESTDQVIERLNSKLLGYWSELQGNVRVNNPERLRSTIQTLEELTRRLKEIEANSRSG